MLRDFVFVTALPSGSEPRPRLDSDLVRGGVRLERAFEVQLPTGTYVVTYAEAEAAYEPPVPPMERVAAWADPAITKHRQGLAFLFPIRPGHAAAFRRFTEEAFRHRRFEHHQSRRSLGLTREEVWLGGDLAVFYIEGDHPRGAFEHLAESTSVHDIWFRDQCRALFLEGLDLDSTPPPIRTLWDRDLSPVPA